MESRRRFVFFSISLVILFIVLILSSSIDLGLQAQAATTDKKSADGAAQSKKFLTYENSNYGIKIQYPSNWTANDKIEQARDTTFVKVAALSPLHSNKSSTPMVRVGLLIDDLSNHSNFDQTGYVNTIIDAYMKGYQDFKVLGINTTTIANQSWYSISASFLAGRSQQNIMETGTMINNKVFFIQYIADEPNFPVNLPIVQKMINSLQLDSSQIRNAKFPSIQDKLSQLDANSLMGPTLASGLGASGPAILEDLRRR
jgi:hypothetical protein